MAITFTASVISHVGAARSTRATQKFSNLRSGPNLSGNGLLADATPSSGIRMGAQHRSLLRGTASNCKKHARTDPIVLHRPASVQVIRVVDGRRHRRGHWFNPSIAHHKAPARWLVTEIW